MVFALRFLDQFCRVLDPSSKGDSEIGLGICCHETCHSRSSSRSNLNTYLHTGHSPIAAPARNRPKTKLNTSLQAGTKGWEGRKTKVDVHSDIRPALSQWEYTTSAASAVLKSFQNRLWDKFYHYQDCTREEENYCIQVYLSLIQHKRLEIVYSPDVASY